MEVGTAIRERKSIRKFEEREVPEDVIKEVVDTARFAPSWKNSQVSRYTAVTSRDVIQELAEDDVVLGFSLNSRTISRCPCVVVQTYKRGISGYEKDGTPTTSKGDKWEVFDAGIAAQTFCLAALEKGLGTVILGIFDEKKVGEIIGIPEDEEVGSIICMGYPAKEPGPSGRKEVSELLRIMK